MPTSHAPTFTPTHTVSGRPVEVVARGGVVSTIRDDRGTTTVIPTASLWPLNTRHVGTYDDGQWRIDVYVETVETYKVVLHRGGMVKHIDGVTVARLRAFDPAAEWGDDVEHSHRCAAWRAKS